MDAPTFLGERLLPGVALRRVGPATFSVLPPGDVGAAYDRRAAVYDLLIGSRPYNRFMWDTAPDDYARFIGDAFTSRSDGAVLDLAAGSCLESAASYTQTDRPTIVLDRSLGMLARGEKRVNARCATPPANVVYLQADALALPFRDASFTSVVCHGALHLFDDPEQCGREWARVLAAEGTLRVSSLALAGRRGDRMLAMLERSGELATPREHEAIAEALAKGAQREASLRRQGNFAFVRLDPR